MLSKSHFMYICGFNYCQPNWIRSSFLLRIPMSKSNFKKIPTVINFLTFTLNLMLYRVGNVVLPTSITNLVKTAPRSILPCKITLSEPATNVNMKLIIRHSIRHKEKSNMRYCRKTILSSALRLPVTNSYTYVAF